MSSMNKVLILGRLGKDPELRSTNDGSGVASFTVATSVVSNKSGERKEYTEWHKCVAYNKAAEIAAQYLKKGAQVLIEGSLRTQKWQNKEGHDQYTTEIVVGRLTMVGGKSEQASEQASDDAPKFRIQTVSEFMANDVPF